MTKQFICTVGTSIAENNYPELAVLPIGGETSQQAKEALDEMKKSIRARKGKPTDQKALAAELKSLLTYGLNRDDLVYLLYSDTLLGKLCADALQYALIEYVGLAANTISLCRVEGLKVDNSGKFEQDGLRNLFEVVINIFENRAGLSINNSENRYSVQVILNPTGGYKATVPYLTLLGSLYGMEVIYISEEVEDIIKLPALPISYDLTIMRQSLPLLQQLAKQNGMEVMLLADLKGGDRELYNDLGNYKNVLVQNVDGYLTLTPLGYLLYRLYIKDYPPELIQTEVLSGSKNIAIRDDHGKDILLKLAKKLVISPYVCEVVNSLPFNRGEANRIRPNQSFENGLVEIVLPKTDAGYGLVIRTTGRNPHETRQIANLLAKDFDW